MKNYMELAELSALLARRNPAAHANKVACDARDLIRLGRRAETNATNLCNIPNYQETFDKRKRSIKLKAAVICGHYGLRAETAGDPRGYCLRLFAVEGSPALRGNTMGGDESGYGI